MAPMTIIHSTNYLGSKLSASFAKTDKESGANALWFQCVPGMSHRARQCCNAYGDRKIKMTPNWFAGWLSSKGKVKWHIYKISERPGNNPNHFFFKYIIVKSGDAFDNKAVNNFQRVEQNIKSHELWNKLAAITFQDKYRNRNDRRIFNHVHVGVVGAPNLRVTR